jgi:hypothetical protein
MLFDIVFIVIFIRDFAASVEEGEVVVLHYIIVLDGLGLTVSHLHYEELWLELLDCLALSDTGGNHLIWAALSEDHLLLLLRIPEYVVSLKSLALV